MTPPPVLWHFPISHYNVADECAQPFGTTLTTLATIEECIVRQHGCRTEELFNTEEPRAKELMRIAGIPVSDLETFSCLIDDNGAGADLADPKGAGKARSRPNLGQPVRFSHGPC